MNAPFNPAALTVGELLNAYSGILDELRRRGLIRTRNAPIGDLAEFAVLLAYGGELAPNSEKSIDVIAADGRRLQVKVRIVSPGDSPSQTFSAIRSWDLDAVVFVIVDSATNTVTSAHELTANEAQSLGRFREHTNSTVIRIGRVKSAGFDVTDKLRTSWAEMLALEAAVEA